MSAKNITVVAIFEAKPGKETELKQALIQLVAPTRREPGCINYDLHQLCDSPAKFLFYENWTSKAHLDIHLKSAHIQALLPRVPELAVGMPEISIWEKLC